MRLTSSLTGEYIAGRERVLGRRVVLPVDDPEAAFVALAEQLGGRSAARRWAHQLANASPLGRIDVDQGPCLYLALEDTPRRG